VDVSQFQILFNLCKINCSRFGGAWPVAGFGLPLNSSTCHARQKREQLITKKLKDFEAINHGLTNGFQYKSL
jgi:hypothetical protein